MHRPDLDLITNLSMVGCPIFEGYPWEYSCDHVNKFIQFCQFVGVQDVYTYSDIFPLSLRGKARDWYRFITPNPNLAGKAIFTKFITDFPSPLIFPHFELFPEILPTPPQCDFFNGPHEKMTLILFLESKQAYQENPYLFLNSQENNFAPHDSLSKTPGVCEEHFSYEFSHVIHDHEVLFVAPHIPLTDDYSEESEIEDLGDDISSCNFYFEDMVEDLFGDPFQPKSIAWPNEYNNEEIQIKYLCLVNKCYPQTSTLCFEDDLTDQLFSPNSFPIYENG
jgi:hypothetical protein